MAQHPQTIYLITGSSGVGKTTVVNELLKQYDRLHRVVSVTTRWPARDHEVFGEHYYFIDQIRFDWLRQTDQLLEYSHEYGHDYGLLRAELERVRQTGHYPIQSLDLHGSDSLRKAGLIVKTVFLDFPNQAAQRQRLIHRQPDITANQLDERMSHAAEERADASRRAANGELTIIVNDHLGACVQDVARAFQLTPSPA